MFHVRNTSGKLHYFLVVLTFDFLNTIFVGCPKAVQFLMDYGAPAGVSNSLGVPALTFIAEKMPDVAYNALSQFKMVDMPKKQVNWFINNLENYDNRGTKNIEKTALEVTHLLFDLI